MSKDAHRLARRGFLKIGTGAVAAGALLGACRQASKVEPEPAAPKPDGDKWDGVRAAFDLDPDYLHFAGFLLAPHPRPVRDAIDKWRRAFDRNAALTVEHHFLERTKTVRETAAKFLGAQPSEVALTDSTTMGLGIVYGGFKLRAGQEILTTAYDHFSTHESLRYRAMRDGAKVRKVELFEHSAKATEAEIVKRLIDAVNEQTRVVAVTWVHSMSGLKLPIKAISQALAKVNAGRDEADRALLCVDGVHGFGIDPISMADFGADFFIAGTHKWVFGPRGTGLVWGTPSAWKNIVPTVPGFEMPMFMAWMKGEEADNVPGGLFHTPGGFHSFEHRWALPEAFAFQEGIGRQAIGERIHALNRQLKEGLAKMPKVEQFTPMADALSAGITCFMVQGHSPKQVVEHLMKKKIIATTTPYQNTYARLAPGLLNTPAEVDTALAEIRALAG